MFPIQIVFLANSWKKALSAFEATSYVPPLPGKIPVGEWGNFLRPPRPLLRFAWFFMFVIIFEITFVFLIDTIIKFSVLLNDISTKNLNVLENVFNDNMWRKDSEFMNDSVIFNLSVAWIYI